MGNGQQAGSNAGRADLARQVAAIAALAPHASPDTVAGRVETLRRAAAAQGLMPAAGVAHALEMAIGRGERGPLIDGWLAILAEAIASGRTDAAATDAYAAACSIRLAG